MAIGGRILTWFEGKWHEGNIPVIRAADHAAWLGSQVFDGARRFEGVMPDLDLHCERIVRSAEALGMNAPVTADRIKEIAVSGAARVDIGLDLYIRPMMWASDGSPGLIDPDPESTAFAVCLEVMPMPSSDGYSLTLAPFIRPRQDMALTQAKTGSLYPNNARIMAWARERGFSNALSCDVEGFVAETASTNVFMARGGSVFTPVPNGCFLNGITRQRVIRLLRADGIDVHETRLTIADFDSAEEIFVTGNIAKITPVSRYQKRVLGKGRITMRARKLYWDYAHSRRKPRATG